MMVALAAVIGAPTGVVAFEDRTEVRGRLVAAETQALDLETRPVLRLESTNNHGDDALVLAYTPRLVLTRSNGGDRADVLQGGLFRADATRGRLHLTAYELITYGTASIGTLLVQPRWNLEDIPPSPFPLPLNTNASFTLLASQAAASADYSLTRRVRVGATASHFAYGGPDAASRRNLPLTAGPALELRSTFDITRNDTFEASTFARYATLRFENLDGPDTTQSNTEARFRHRFSAWSFAEASAGFSVQRQPDIGTSTFPIAEAVVSVGSRQRAARVQVVFVARSAPWISFNNGDVVQRHEGIVAAAWTKGLTTLGLQAAYQVAPTQGLANSRYEQVLGQASFERRVTRTVAFDFGLRVGGQSVSSIATNVSLLQAGAYVGITYSPRGAKL